MYIWGAIDVESQLKEQKEKVMLIENDISFLQSNICSLPLHISLKITSECKKNMKIMLEKKFLNYFS